MGEKWKESGDHQLRLVGYPVIFQCFLMSQVPGGTEFCPSTESLDTNPQKYTQCH